MSTHQSIEAIYEDEDDRPQSERELEAYHASVQHLDPDDVLHTACATLPFQSSALEALVTQQLQYPYDDVSKAVIHPSLAQQIARECLEAIAASIDCLAGVQAVVGGER